jgi:hypothetical protein
MAKLGAAVDFNPFAGAQAKVSDTPVDFDPFAPRKQTAQEAAAFDNSMSTLFGGQKQPGIVNAIADDLVQPASQIQTIEGANGEQFVMPDSVPAAVAHNERLQRDPVYRQQFADAQMQRDAEAAATAPGAHVGAVVDRPDRSFGELASDMGMTLRQGMREDLALPLLELPVNAVNTVNTAANFYADGLAGAFGQDANDIPMYAQPEALQQLRRDTLAMDAAETERDQSAALAYDTEHRPGDFAGALGYMMEHPGVIATDASRSAGAMSAMLLPGGVESKIALQAFLQAGGTQAQVEQELYGKLVREGVPAEEAAQTARVEANKAFGLATTIGLALPKIVPGGTAFEEMMAGKLGQRAGGLAAHATALAGETVSEAGEEGLIQATQNVFAGDPAMQGVGGAAAQGGLLGAGMGGATVAPAAARATVDAITGENDTTRTIAGLFDLFQQPGVAEYTAAGMGQPTTATELRTVGTRPAPGDVAQAQADAAMEAKRPRTTMEVEGNVSGPPTLQPLQPAVSVRVSDVPVAGNPFLSPAAPSTTASSPSTNPERQGAGSTTAADHAPQQPQDAPRAPSLAGGLFGAPTARELADGASRAKDDKRNGNTGNVIPSFAGTALGAGAAPQQVDVEDATAGERSTDGSFGVPMLTREQIRADADAGLAETAGGVTEGAPAPEPNFDPIESDGFKREWVPKPTSVPGRFLRVPTLNYAHDNLLHWIAANGGVNFDQLRSYAGVDPAAKKEYPFGVKNLPVLRANGGMTLESLTEKMREDGWFADWRTDDDADDAHSNIKYSLADASNMLMDALNGGNVQHPVKGADERAAAREVANENASRDASETNYRFAQEDRADAEGAHQRGLQALRAANAPVAPEDEAEARTVDDLQKEAAALGATDIDLLWAENETAGEYAARLHSLIATRKANGPADPRTSEYPRPAQSGRSGSQAQGRGQARRIDGGLPATGWAAATVVKDRDGNPRVVHRGDNTGATRPESFSGLGARADQPTSYLGVWFSTEQNDAAKYGATGAYYLDLRNPKIYHYADFPDPDTAEEATALRKQLQSQGYDGMAMDMRTLSGAPAEFHYVAFKPEQVIDASNDAAADEDGAQDAPRTLKPIERFVPKDGAKGKKADFARRMIVPVSHAKGAAWEQTTRTRDYTIEERTDGEGNRVFSARIDYYRGNEGNNYTAFPTIRIVKSGGLFTLEADGPGAAWDGVDRLPGYGPFDNENEAEFAAKEAIQESALVDTAKGSTIVYPEYVDDHGQFDEDDSHDADRPTGNGSLAGGLNALTIKEPEHNFPPPPSGKTIQGEALADGEVLSQDEADARVAEWKAAAKRVGETQDNSNKVVFSLFDHTGTWSQPWRDAGYTVYQYDVQDGDDLMQFFPGADIVAAIEDGKQIYGVLAAPPCTSFAVSGARWWADQHDTPNRRMVAKKYGDWASEYFDTPVEYAETLVNITRLFVEFANPSNFHVLENPIGRIQERTGLPKPVLSFDPSNFGNPYTKRTQLWGDFNPQLPTANVEATEGSRMQNKLRGDNPADKVARSTTPAEFAYAFFMANHDNGALLRDAGEAQGDEADLYDPAIDEAEDEADDIDALESVDEVRRIRKRKKKNSGVKITHTRDEAALADELNIFTDNGHAEDDIANMPPKQQLVVAQGIVKKVFGFKSLTVANNLNTIEALNQLKYAYRNLQSMAAIMGWPVQTFGKIVPNLELVRNPRGGLAYYSNQQRLIGMSRQSDTFAHEFGHGIDWWVWNTMKLVDPNTGEPKGRAATGKLRLGGSISDNTIETAFGQLLSVMYKTNADAAFKIASIEKHILVIRNQIADLQARADVSIDDERKAAIEASIAKREAHITRLSNQISQIKNAPKASYQADTNYYLNARLMDKKFASLDPADGGYWQRPTEMFARAFEAYVSHQLEQLGASTEFLGHTDAGYLKEGDEFIQKAYPQAMDRTLIFNAIDGLMGALRDSLTAGVQGPVATVQLADPLPPAAWADWVPRDVTPISVWSYIKQSHDEAKHDREQAKRDDAPMKEAKKRLRDARNAHNGARAKWEDFKLRNHDQSVDARAAWAQTITGFFNTMEKRYPQSATFKQVSRIFVTKPGTGQLRAETFEQYRGTERNKWGNELARISDQHNLNSHKAWSEDERRLLRDALVDHRKAEDRPAYSAKILRAAQDLRRFHDRLYMFLQNNGIDVGYARNGYLERIMNEASVSADQAGFLDAATKVYREVFARDVGTPEKFDADQMVQYAAELLGKADPEVKELRKLMATLESREAEGDEDGAAEVRAAIEALLTGGLYDRIADAFARAASNDWMARILGTVANDDFSVQGAQGSFMKSRVLPESADLHLGDFMVTDPMALAATYMTSAVNRVAFEKFLPGEGAAAARIDAIRAALVRDGVLPDDVTEAVESIKIVTGLYRPNVTKRGLRRNSAVVAIVTPVLLGRSIFSQVAEPATVGLRTGNATDAVAVFSGVLADIGLWLPGVNKAMPKGVRNRAAARRELAEFIGAVTDAHFDHIMNNRENTLWANKRAGKTLANFYHNSLIHPHAMAMRRATVERSVVYMKRIARKALAGNQLAVRDLADLGIDFADKALVKYLATEMPSSLAKSDLLGNKHARAISIAINRFVDEAIMNPKIVDKPRLASTAEKGFMYGILSFQSAFTNNVLLRQVDRLNTTAKTDGLGTAAHEAAVSTAMLTIFLSLQAAQYMLRYAMFGRDDLDDELKRWKEDPANGIAVILSRSGMFGMLDPLVNAITSAKYRRSYSDMLAGAYYGYLLRALDRVTGAAVLKADKGNTQERNAAEGVYDGLVAPVVAAAVLRFAPWATVGLAWTSSAGARSEFADLAAGEKKEKGSSAVSGTAADNRRTTRQNGRQAGREGGR